MKNVNLNIGEKNVNISEAMDMAKERAALELGIAPDDVLVVSWYDCREDKHSPNLVSGWEDYGKSHGATLRLEINEGEYVFLCEDFSLH